MSILSIVDMLGRPGFFLLFFLIDATARFSFRRLHKCRYHKKFPVLYSSDPDDLLDTMQKSFGEKTDMAELAEVQSREVMKGLKDLDRDPNIMANNRFIEWLDANEVWVKSRSSWGRAQHPLV